MLATRCEFGEKQESLITDIAFNCNDADLQGHLLLEHDLDLKRAVGIARVSEETKKQVSEMNRL